MASVTSFRPRRKRRRRTPEERRAMELEALSRARSGSMSNFVPVIAEFSARGIPEAEILPKENVFTFHAWRALGRTVRKGERGVKITTWIPLPDKVDEETGETKPGGNQPTTAVVFHVSQTKAIGE